MLCGRLPGIHLNSEGLRQAAILGEVLKQRYSLDAIVSSPLERAIETARPIAEAQNKSVLIEPRLTEIDFGNWVGKSFDELHGCDEWQDFNRQRSLRNAPGGESMTEVQSRSWRAIETFTATLEDGSTIAFVSHGDVIRCLLLLFLGMSIDHIHRLEVAPSSISEIVLGKHDPLVKHVNQIFY